LCGAFFWGGQGSFYAVYKNSELKIVFSGFFLLALQAKSIIVIKYLVLFLKVQVFWRISGPAFLNMS